jgi:hypothetical protein
MTKHSLVGSLFYLFIFTNANKRESLELSELELSLSDAIPL